MTRDMVRAMPRTESGVDPVVPVGPVVIPTGRRRLANARAAWPLRRLVAVAVLFPVLMALLVAVTGGTVAPLGWTTLVGLVALACASTLATYLPRPGNGARLDVGCTPCASVVAVSVLIAAGVLSTAPHDVPTAVLALGVALFGLRQRLTDPSTCAA